jgi:hypothetical protein
VEAIHSFDGLGNADVSIKIAGTAPLLQTADSITECLSCPDQPKLPDSGRITGKSEVIHLDPKPASVPLVDYLAK